MELNIDLLPKRKRSNFTLIMGLISIAFPIIYYITSMLEDKELSGSFLPMMIYLGINGINLIVSGLGFSMEKLFGTAYVQVDDERIAIKTGVWKKVQSSNWSEIKSMEYKTNWFKFNYMDGSSSTLRLSVLEFKVLVETKNVIYAIAAEKGISIH
jgi:hypothetical protein